MTKGTIKNRNWLIWRGRVCLTGFFGSRQEAEDFAYETYGIGCSILSEA
jgi:hypothetical protein